MITSNQQEETAFKISFIIDDLKRLVKNRVLMCDSLAMAFFLLSTANRHVGSLLNLARSFDSR